MKSPIAFEGGFCSFLGSSFAACAWDSSMAAWAAGVLGSSTVLTFLGSAGASSAGFSSLGSSAFLGSGLFALGVAFLLWAWGLAVSFWDLAASTTSRVLTVDSVLMNPVTQALTTSQTAKASAIASAYVPE